MKSEEILRKFEDDIVAGKNPTPAEYEAKYGKIDEETKSLMEVMMGLVLLGEEAKLPEGFEERQRKLARDLIARKKAEEMVAHWQAGEKAFGEGDYSKAREHYERLLTFVKYLKDESWIAFSSSRLGNILDAQGDKEKALEYDIISAEVYRKLGMKRELMINLHNMGNLYLDKKDYRNSQKAYEEAIELNEEAGGSFPLPHEYLNLGVVEKYLNNREKAGNCFQTSYEMFIKTKNLNGMASAEYNIAELEDNMGNTGKAIRTYELALEHFRETNNWQLIAQTCGALGCLYTNQGKLDKAKDCYEEALEALKKEKTRNPDASGRDSATLRKKPKHKFVMPQIPDEAKRDPARLLRFLLDKDAEERMYQKI
jgi:tetratricopeptide (TPR) repeat protein